MIGGWVVWACFTASIDASTGICDGAVTRFVRRGGTSAGTFAGP